MKKQLLFFTTVLSFMSLTFAQSLDCENTCVLDKVVHEGTFLGVYFGTPCDKETEKGVVVLDVIENTAAFDNNFKAYDIVMKINGIEVNNRGDAIEIITAYNPFDVVSFLIYRDGKNMTKKVVLGAKTTKIVQEKVCCEMALSSLSENNISVYPSPAREHLNISFETIVQDNYTFGIYMANGVLVKQYDKMLDSGSLKETIPVNKMEDGVYILRISNKENTFSKLFVVSRE
ncbi:PDZ domain-containing protein [Lacinutrix jangbogonensis]|uniref:PDZ domain-containing protein n=1 Tax=Lacinutrix jangbogonensis TaxID=1469557 RepID=UPI00053D798F|nr:PDZ domain-containing protein [Lacinutrix jangbogonensis]